MFNFFAMLSTALRACAWRAGTGPAVERVLIAVVPAVVVVVAEPVGLHADRCGLALHVALRARHVTVLEKKKIRVSDFIMTEKGSKRRKEKARERFLGSTYIVVGLY